MSDKNESNRCQIGVFAYKELKNAHGGTYRLDFWSSDGLLTNDIMMIMRNFLEFAVDDFYYFESS